MSHRVQRHPCKLCRNPVKQNRTTFCSRLCMGAWYRKNYSDALREMQRKMKLGKKNPMWRGSKVGYNALHEWVKNHLEKPKYCERCRKAKRLDLANISQKYFRALTDWEWLCRKCHMRKDGRGKRLGEIMKKVSKQQARIRTCLVCEKKEIIPLYILKKVKTCGRSCGMKLIRKEVKLGIRPPWKKRTVFNLVPRSKKTGRFE